MKNSKKKLAIAIFIILMISLVVFLLKYKSYSVAESVQDKGVKLVAYGWKDGKKVATFEISPKKTFFSSVEVNPPNIPYQELDAISIQHTIISDIMISDVNIDVSDLAGTFATTGLGDLSPTGDLRYENALIGKLQTFTLLIGGQQIEESSPFSITDLEDDCNVNPFCIFKLQVVASYIDVDPDTGKQIITNIPLDQSYGTIIMRIFSDTCTDGTPFGRCSNSDPGGLFCDGINNLIDCASPTGCTPAYYAPTSCSCKPGYYETNGDRICSAPLCDGGTRAGMCTGSSALICDPNCNQESCGAVIQDCYFCGQSGQEAGYPLGWVNPLVNKWECPPAWTGEPSISCTEATHKCKYKGKKGAVNVILE